MTGAMVVISRPRLRTSHDTVVAFLRAAGCAIVRVRVSRIVDKPCAGEMRIYF